MVPIQQGSCKWLLKNQVNVLRARHELFVPLYSLMKTVCCWSKKTKYLFIFLTLVSVRHLIHNFRNSKRKLLQYNTLAHHANTVSTLTENSQRFIPVCSHTHSHLIFWKTNGQDILLFSRIIYLIERRNFDQKYKFSNKNDMESALRNFKNIFLDHFSLPFLGQKC